MPEPRVTQVRLAQQGRKAYKEVPELKATQEQQARRARKESKV
jgi:hypothetical protein